MYDAIDDPYTYENSTVLVNKLDLRDQRELDDFEAEITSARASEPLPEGNLDFAHFCTIHHHLFQDVFDWAGTPRTVRISKQGSAFCFPEHIEVQSAKLFSDLKAENNFENLPANKFAEKAAHFLAELNAIHAFREGNGRTQLTFFALLADRAGQPLDLERLDPERHDRQLRR
ncbi:cell filamentation protein [Bradyrhizobium lablabi]|uniref:protein adenylyltransferase n=1 Tax=Bradyrhizobium lablabi TaxID=722472 RepID=A0A1M6Z5H1_9BRAD|nr:cell filamentation protein [Bradyrhizobium lablabi]